MDEKDVKEEILKKVLGAQLFFSIRNFFMLIEEKEADYIVYVAKKCYTLYLEFMDLFEADRSKVHCSDIMLANISTKLRGKKVLLVDDVLIHGRTLQKLKKNLEELGCTVELYLFALNASEGANVLDTIRDEANYYFKCNNYEWKKISDLVMHSFWATNTPYCAYMPVIELNEDGYKQLFSKKRLFLTRQSDTDSTLRVGQKFEYYFSERKSEYHSYFCMSLLKNNIQKNYKWLPNLFLSNKVLFDKEKQKRFYLVMYDSAMARSLIKELGLKENKISEEQKIFQAKYFIYTLSFCLSGEYIRKAGLSENMYTIQSINLQYSFGRKFSKYFKDTKRLWNKKIRDRIYNIVKFEDKMDERDLSKREEYIYDRKDLYAELENAISNTINWYGEAEKDVDKRIKHYSHMLSRYYKKNGIMDEEFVHPGGRLSGLPVRKLLLRVIEKTGASVQDIVAAFLNQYYLGYSTLSFRKGAGELGCYSHAGEQSYKCVVHEFVVPVYFLYRYTQYFPEKMVEKMKQVLLNVTEIIYKEHGIKFEKNDFEMYSLGADENIYDRKTILVHSTENEKQGMNELVKKGYMLEEFVSTTPGLTDIPLKVFEMKFLKYCGECQEI